MFTALAEASFRAGKTLSSIPYDDGPNAWWRRAIRIAVVDDYYENYELERFFFADDDYDSYELKRSVIELELRTE